MLKCWINKQLMTIDIGNLSIKLNDGITEVVLSNKVFENAVKQNTR